MGRVTAWRGAIASALAIYDAVIAREPGNREAFSACPDPCVAGDLSGAQDLREVDRGPSNDRASSMDYARTRAWDGS